MRQLYLAATGMNRGKTTFALGLVAALLDRDLATGFIKPVGQRYALVDDVPADEDAILVREVFGMTAPLAQMSPVHIPRGFTKAFIGGEVVDDLPARISTAHRAAAADADVLVIEGTGHAGVGSVVGLSNAEVAAILGAPALIISEGGVGKPIDEIVLNHALFARRGVTVAGAIVNKVDDTADPGLPDILRRGLARHGIELLGTLPYRPILSNPTIAMLSEQMKGEVLHPGDDPERVVEHVAIAAMQPRHVLERIGPGSLVIVPGDRDDVIQALVTADRHGRDLLRPFGRTSRRPDRHELAGMIVTGGYQPRPRELEAIRSSGLFAYLVQEDTYQAASRVHDLLVKTHPADTAKIAEIKRLVAEHIDIDRLLGTFGAWPPAHGASPAGDASAASVDGLSGSIRASLRRLGSLAGRGRDA